MAVNKLFPKNQQYVDLRDGKTISISKVTLLGAAADTNYLPLGNADDVAVLQSSVETAAPTFYLSGNNDSIFNVEVSATHPAGTEFVVVGRHSGSVNLIESD